MISSIDKESFLSALRKSGIEPDGDIAADGRLRRFRDWLDKPGTKNCWYVLFSDYPPAGAYGCWRRGIRRTWIGSASVDDPLLANRLESISRLLSLEYEKGRELAVDLWQKAIPANGQHQYLRKKKVGTYGLRYSKGALLIPVKDASGQLHGLQRVYHDGSKRFTKGTDKAGHFHLIGTPKDSTLYIAEGYATAATVHEVTCHAIAVAFDSGNLQPVAEALRSAYPGFQLIICADDDRWKDSNPGLTKARAAAAAVSGRLALPRFSNFTSRGSDFNDLYCEEGAEAIRICFATIGGFDV
jgi:putative DNA primase/helicase